MKYICAMCEGEFESEWTEAEAVAEKERDFGSVPLEECDQVCDECYKQISPQNNPDYYERYLTASANLRDPPNLDAEAIRAYINAELCRRLGEAMDKWEVEELFGISPN